MKSKKINVDGTQITIMSQNNEDYISLTDIIKAKDGDFFIAGWLRNRNTVEFLGAWEQLNNPGFNYGEFAIIKSQAGLNSYKISVKEWAEKTNGIGLVAKAGRYGGTYAHKDIAFEFGMTAKEWHDKNPNENGNMRDNADVYQLVSLANLETHNAKFIKQGLSQE